MVWACRSRDWRPYKAALHLSHLTYRQTDRQTNALEHLSAGQMRRQLKQGEEKALEDRRKDILEGQRLCTIHGARLYTSTANFSQSSEAQDSLNDELFKLGQYHQKIEREYAKAFAKGGRNAEEAARR